MKYAGIIGFICCSVMYTALASHKPHPISQSKENSVLLAAPKGPCENKVSEGIVQVVDSRLPVSWCCWDWWKIRKLRQKIQKSK